MEPITVVKRLSLEEFDPDRDEEHIAYLRDVVRNDLAQHVLKVLETIGGTCQIELHQFKLVNPSDSPQILELSAKITPIVDLGELEKKYGDLRDTVSLYKSMPGDQPKMFNLILLKSLGFITDLLFYIIHRQK